jgi:hypothetical protein
MFVWFKEFLQEWVLRRRLKKLKKVLPTFVSLNTAEVALVSSWRSPVPDKPVEDNREECNPIAILHEFEVPVEIDLAQLTVKLSALVSRAEFYTSVLCRQPPTALMHAIMYLQARKQYPSLGVQIPWKTTTRARIDALVTRYRLEFNSISLFLPELPTSVIAEIEKFDAMYRKAVETAFHTKTSLDLWLIAPPAMFKKESKDPILLAKSPFGDFYYILCAWDAEVKLLPELLEYTE